MHTYRIFDGPVANLLSVLCLLIEIFSRAHEKRKKVLNDFKFGTSFGRFQSDGGASMAVKGLILLRFWWWLYDGLFSLCGSERLDELFISTRPPPPFSLSPSPVSLMVSVDVM